MTARSLLGLLLVAFGLCRADLRAATHRIEPAIVTDGDEAFERIANQLEPGDELILADGVYSQNGRRAITAQGTAERPIVIRAAEGASPLLTRPATDRDRQNNVEFVDCAHLIIRGLRFQGGIGACESAEASSPPVWLPSPGFKPPLPTLEVRQD